VNLAHNKRAGGAINTPAHGPNLDERRNMETVSEASAPRNAGDDYAAFLAARAQYTGRDGFAPRFMPRGGFDFQCALVDWMCRLGRAGTFADTGMGKSAMEAAAAENVVRHTNGRVLVLTPLACAPQWVREANKFGVEASRGAVAGPGVYVANYERLHHYDPADFVGCVGDESSILKNFDGRTKAAVTEFMRRMRYRFLFTATPSPNDHVELGTSSEALGYLGHMDMLARFFKNDRNTADTGRKWGNHGGGAPGWRFKGHAETPFWRWVTSWARALRRPSDVGPFDDSRYALPPLVERQHVVGARRPREGWLFAVPAHGLSEQREERKRTTRERCERAAALVAGTGQSALCWANTNDEADLLERLIPGSIQVSGRDSDDTKEDKFAAFESGQARVLVTKQSIASWGLNWQHCAHQTLFAGYSFEQYYQAIRRSWRYGQTREVVVEHVVSDGEGEVLASRQRKARQAEELFARLVEHMRAGQQVARSSHGALEGMEVPSWLL
jgi:hypothetical protein